MSYDSEEWYYWHPKDAPEWWVKRQREQNTDWWKARVEEEREQQRKRDGQERIHKMIREDASGHKGGCGYAGCNCGNDPDASGW